MFKKILWVTDFSEQAHHAGKRAIQCAMCNHGNIYALTVVDPEDLPLILEGVPDPFITMQEEEELEQRLETEYEQDILDHLEKEIRSLNDTETQFKSLLLVGTPWQEIVRAADELQVTLIVIGSHGKRSLEDILLGSTVERVSRHANCPVLVVR